MLNHNDDQNEAKRMMLFCVAAASFVLLLFLIVLYTHDNKNSSKHKVKNNVPKVTTEENDIEIKKSNIVSSDLDFWDMYDDEERKPIEDIDDEEEDEKKETAKRSEARDKELNKKTSSSSSKYDDSDDEESMNNSRKKDKDIVDDKDHIKVIGQDGKPSWYDILEDVKKNNYDFDNYLVYDNGLLKYNSSEITSLTGIDISNKQGIIDFIKVKNAGVDFVMIKVASRGYETGQINIDDKFVEYANGATAAGLSIGAYISSQAITDIEAVEEANYAVAAANNYNVKFPIAIDFTSVSNDSERTDKLTSSERTAIVKKFCETVKSYGKTPAICASRDFLIANLDLEDLSGYDIWLKDEAVVADYMKVEHIEDINDEDDNNDSSSSSSSSNSSKTSSSSTSSSSSSSSSAKKSSSSSKKLNNNDDDEDLPDYIGTDYPYNFSLWQCSKKGSINGIEGAVDINLSFINYAER